MSLREDSKDVRLESVNKNGSELFLVEDYLKFEDPILILLTQNTQRVEFEIIFYL